MEKADSEYAAFMDPLLRKRERLTRELEQVNAAIEALKAASEAGGTPIVSNQEGSPQESTSLKPAEKPHNGYEFSDVNHKDGLLDGMTQPEMAYTVLKHVGKPMLSREILDVWVKHGRTPVGVDGNQKVQVAIKRRQKSHQDVIHIGDGKWGLREWYSSDDIEKFIKSATTYAFDKRTHQKRMVDGIKRAKDSGALWGRKPSLREKQWNLAVELIKTDGIKMTEIHRRLLELNEPDQEEFTYQLIIKYRDQFLAGEPYPENWRQYFERLTHETASDDPPKVRLVK